MGESYSLICTNEDQAGYHYGETVGQAGEA